MRKSLTLVLSCIATLILAGCVTNPTTGKQELSEEGMALIEGAAVVGLIEYLRDKPDAVARIANIRKVAEELKTVEESTTLDALRVRVNNIVAKRYPNQFDQMQVLAFVDRFDVLLRKRIGEGALDKLDVLHINDFADMLLRVLPKTAAPTSP